MNISLSEMLHVIGQVLLNPCLIILLLLAAASVWQVGDAAMEYWTERHKLRINVPELLKQMSAASGEEIKALIKDSGISPRQRDALLSVLEAKNMSKSDLIALSQRLLSTEEERCERTTAITDMIAKLGPMFGLLGTLIPLGPGIVALGQGDTATLAGSLGVAFDTTIVGVISAAVACVISNVRRH